MDYKTYIEYVKADLYRHDAAKGLIKFLSHITTSPGFKCIFWVRTCHYLQKKRFLFFLYLIARYLHKWYKYKYGIWIPFNTKIGKGFYIGHFNGIFIGSIVVIGDNCNISQNVTIGKQNVGERIGAPTIGKNVYIAPGAKIFGRINIGDEVAIGANTVVTKDIPDKAVVIGNPDRIVGYNGFDGLVEYTDY